MKTHQTGLTTGRAGATEATGEEIVPAGTQSFPFHVQLSIFNPQLEASL